MQQKPDIKVARRPLTQMLQSTRMGGNIKKGKTRNTLFSLNLKTPKRWLFNAPIFELTGCKKWQERKHGNLPAFTKN